MSEVRKCPKCGGEMEEGNGLASHNSFVFYMTKGAWHGDKVHAFHCKNCGFIEIYKEKKEKKEGVKP